MKSQSQSSYAIQHRCSVDMFRQKVCKHFLGGLLSKRFLAFREQRLHPEKHGADMFHSTKSSSASIRNSCCGIHPHVGFKFPSPVQENTLKAQHLRRCTHQPTILRFTGAECDHCLTLCSMCKPYCFPASTHSQKRSSWSECNQHDPCHTKILYE